MANSLIITFDEFINDLGLDTYSVFVNGQLRTSDSIDIIGIYSTYIETFDVVTISIETSPTGLLRIIDVIRRDYTTDDIDGDSGIRDTFVSSTSGTTGTVFTSTFTATTIASCYNYEYRVSISTFDNPSCEIEGTVFGSPLLPPITTGLTIYANGNTFTGSTGTSARYWFDDRGNFNGRTSTNAGQPNQPVWKIFNTGFFEINNYTISFPDTAYTIPTSGVSFTFGGWIQTVQTSTDVTIFSAGIGLALIKNLNNYWEARANSPIYGPINATSSTLLNPNTNIWNYIICKWTPGDSLKIYLNGVLIANTSTLATTIDNVSGFRISGGIVNVSSFQVYYLALTDDQILFNFNQLKSYYGY